MGMTVYDQQNFRRVQQDVWGRLFGIFIQKGREKRDYSVEEAARLAGMAQSAWLAVEAGHVPETAAQLRSMGGALGISETRLKTMVLICQDAWK